MTRVPTHGEVTTPDGPTPTDVKRADGQYESYWVLSDEERVKGFVRPYREEYQHRPCGRITRMGTKIAETFAADPEFYGSTYCSYCRNHFALNEFLWAGTTEVVGS